MKRLLMTGLIVCAAVLPLVAEDAAPPADPTPTPEEEAAPAKKKKPPKKQAEYRSWAAAAAAAEAWEQPVLALFEVAGDKTTSKIKAGTICSQPFQKEFIPENLIYFRCVVPAAKTTKKGEAPEANIWGMKTEDQAMVRRLTGYDRPALPMIVLVDYTGRILDATLCPFEEEVQLGKFVESVKTAMTTAKYEVTINKRLQKAVDKEAKELEKAAKRAKK